MNDPLALLHRLCGPDGIAASESDTANYAAVFARDGVIAGLAGLLADDAVLVDGLVRTLDGLRERQGPQGQIPSNYHGAHISYGRLTPKLDAATWFLVGTGAAVRAGAVPAEAFRAAVGRTVTLLGGIEYNERHLLYVPQGGNWADEYPLEGYTLYDNALRAWGLRLCAHAFDEPLWAAKADRILDVLRVNVWPRADLQDDPRVYHPAQYARTVRADRWHALAAFGPAAVDDGLDLAGTALAALVDDELAPDLLGGLDAAYLSNGELPPVFAPVLSEGAPGWERLRAFHLFAFRNRPHEYHNGGVWPVWLGWLALALRHRGRTAQADALADHAEAAMHAPGFDFHEYLHGLTLAPGGTPRMAYTASGQLLLRASERMDLLLPV